ncbi:MAG: 23S rRNA (pseudouridine(1915)-N(3))-methyltransferase RlmH [Verrucomicrobia bacterium]|nr:23S rRNA (pseudouridine(1915)-N(3))-methyltransferase RlmH [Verrucomicrobiota bacterium]
MTWKILAAGKPALEFARLGIEDYLSRLQRSGKAEIHFVKTGPALHRRMLELSEGCHRILLDERGATFTSRAFAAEIQKLQNRSVSKCALLVGAADGWDEETRAKADLLWSLGPQTLQHELALVVALEQIHRAQGILAGTPYHRD